MFSLKVGEGGGGGEEGGVEGVSPVLSITLFNQNNVSTCGNTRKDDWSILLAVTLLVHKLVS